jgi:hypothetical protein
VLDAIDIALDVQVNHPVYGPFSQAHIQGIQRLMRVAPRSETVAETHKLRFVDGIQRRGEGLLNDLILQRGHPQLALASVILGNTRSLAGRRPIASLVDPVM